jgi:TetR/AcrR family transcriptional regulator, transcriptional repressor for nem operon
MYSLFEVASSLVFKWQQGCYMAPRRSTSASLKRPRRSRAPDVTRERLLQAAFEEIYQRGFQAASLETILARAGVTKGALYHHFPDKAALGAAVVNQVVHRLLLQRWSVGSLANAAGDPLTALQNIIRHRSAELTSREVQLGCPLNNLAQEMSPLDQRFRRLINRTFETWRSSVEQALQRGKAQGAVRQDVDASKMASFVVASIEGSYGLAKNAQSIPILRSNLEILIGILDSLRPAPREESRAGRSRARS